MTRCTGRIAMRGIRARALGKAAALVIDPPGSCRRTFQDPGLSPEQAAQARNSIEDLAGGLESARARVAAEFGRDRKIETEPLHLHGSEAGGKQLTPEL